MPTRFFGALKAGTTSVSLDCWLTRAADGLPDTGKLAADLGASYYRQGTAAPVPFTLHDLSALDAPWAAGGVREISDGSFRVDWPDPAFDAGTAADWVELTVKDGTIALYKERIALEAAGVTDLWECFVPAEQAVGGSLNGPAGTIVLAEGTALTSLPPAPAEVWIHLCDGPGAGTYARVLWLAGRTAGVAGWPLGTPTDQTIYTLTAVPDGRIGLTPDGLDAVPVEAGCNARQALSPILAACAGTTPGMGTAAGTIRAAGDPSVTRIGYTVNPATGERLTTTLHLPA